MDDRCNQAPWMDCKHCGLFEIQFIFRAKARPTTQATSQAIKQVFIGDFKLDVCNLGLLLIYFSRCSVRC